MHGHLNQCVSNVLKTNQKRSALNAQGSFSIRWIVHFHKTRGGSINKDAGANALTYLFIYFLKKSYIFISNVTQSIAQSLHFKNPARPALPN
jgi:hypothetical protein